MGNRAYRLTEMTWEDVAHRLEDSNPVVLLPVGSTEQHGRHLPLGTDTFVAIDLVEEAAPRTGALVAPPMWCGMSPHHMMLPGTISIRPEILLEYLYDVIASLAAHGFTSFVIVNGHRVANIPWLQLVAERVHRTLEGTQVAVFDPAWMSREIDLGLGEMGHGEEIETSHMLAALPELTRMERAEDNPPDSSDLYHPDPGSSRDTLCFVPSRLEQARRTAEKAGGVTGSPTLADAEKGQKYREHLVGRLVQVIESM